jgi:hypothetical protein
MKAKIIVAAIAALCSAGAMAQLNPATATSYLTYYIGGASTQAGAVSIIAPTLFASGTPIVTITQTTSTNTLTAYYGMSNATYTTTSQPLLVIYNSTNGSFAGLGQLIYNGAAASDPWFESKVLQIGPSGDALTCQLTTAPYTCTTTDNTHDAFVQIDMALADVQPDEGYAGIITPGVGTNLALNQLVITTTGLEGFGVAVNPALYQALQAAQGLTVGSLTAANQPSVQSTDIASLFSESGAEKSAADFLQDNDQTLLTVVNRTFDSGTQAAADMYFMNNVCGNVGYDGSLSPVSINDGGAAGLNPGFFNVIQEEATGNVKTDLTGTNTAGYAIGILSLTAVPTSAATSWQFVKLDGISPNYSATGVADAHQRNAFASGAYKFATDMSAAYRKTTAAANLAMNKAVVAGLQNSALHNLTGIGYLDNPSGTYTAGGQQARYDRNGNNCSPLVDTNF